MHQHLILPKNYRPLLGVRETERAIKNLKDFFELNLATELNLCRVTAPLFVKSGTGINDDLNGVERPVAFPIKGMANTRAEIVQSLAKWKRLMLAELGFDPGFGLYTDMNAIRPDELLDNTHSIYVDQWDWERVLRAEERQLDFLKKIVRKIYSILKRTEQFISRGQRNAAAAPGDPQLRAAPGTAVAPQAPAGRDAAVDRRRPGAVPAVHVFFAQGPRGRDPDQLVAGRHDRDVPPAQYCAAVAPLNPAGRCCCAAPISGPSGACVYRGAPVPGRSNAGKHKGLGVVQRAGTTPSCCGRGRPHSA
jgi:hypothetical protein